MSKKSAKVTRLEVADIYQIKITLKWSKPSIWQRIPVRSGIGLGKLATPPDNYSGILNYVRMLEILVNPKDEEHEDTREWLSEKFDSRAFDLNTVNGELGELR